MVVVVEGVWVLAGTSGRLDIEGTKRHGQTHIHARTKHAGYRTISFDNKIKISFRYQFLSFQTRANILSYSLIFQSSSTTYLQSAKLTL